MAKALKSKEKIVSGKKAEHALSESKTAVAPDIEQVLAYWSEEVNSLQSHTFDSVDAAIDMVISRVASRFGPAESSNTALKEFLRELLHSDPEFVQDLSDSLKIKSKD